MSKPQIATAANGWVNTAESESLESTGAIALAASLISEQIYCTLATASIGGIPWSTPLFYVFDQELNLYWSSAIAAQHSQNLAQNEGRSFITLYDVAKVKAVYFSGFATELNGEMAAQNILKLFDQRAKRPNPRLAKDYLGQSCRRMYKFTPEKVWVTGDRLTVDEQLVDTKIQLNLNSLKAIFHKA
ncbi:pyridoxamine 5'-phosphate oxidase family protein [[Limnothrix rosea] IAM M-220]|uniref:pyridoxamine 5'-phosphate oxidase family protein n=1 Tax=[Limnothrix rosea] IAM M-220 TaxID=454133 RepID=UPI0009687FE7|nr:pyridoxamine 5'-phosphate oxidase family protein [[Limnothrix rosea] IAM M-220]OKH16024.1 pyridoxamine 5'-phosphate oxidase [[Limnothrix rosea] IAM M-220]